MANTGACIICGDSTGALTAIKQKGLQSLKDLSTDKDDSLHHRLQLGNRFFIHESCRRNYRRKQHPPTVNISEGGTARISTQTEDHPGNIVNAATLSKNLHYL
jgi:hypothetical protein